MAILARLAFLVVVLATGHAWAAPAPPLSLTGVEQAYLKAHPSIRVSNELDFQPYDFAVNGQPRGFSIDVLKLVAERAGIKLRFITGPSWDQLVQMQKNGKIDLLHSLTVTPKREQIGIFSTPYLRSRMVFVSRKGEPDFSALEQLDGKTVAVGKGWSLEELLSAKHPRIKRLAVSNIEEMLDAVSSGKADVMVDDINPIRYWIRTRGFSDLKTSNWAARNSFNAASPNTMHFYARKDAAPLISILNKALAALPAEQMRNTQQTWFGDDEADAGNSPIEMSPAERHYVNTHPVIRVSNEADYPPFDFAVNGKPQGFSIDLLNLLAPRIGVRLEYLTGRTWDQYAQLHSQGQLDLLHTLYRSKDRERHGEFSEPYIRARSVFVSRKGEAGFTDFKQLAGKTIAVGKGWGHEEFLLQNYPGINRLTVNSLEEMLEAVSKGRADATVEAEGAVQYWLRKKGLTDLHVSGWAKEYDRDQVAAFHFYARKDAPQLASLLNKAMASLTPTEMQTLQEKWFGKNDAKEVPADGAVRTPALSMPERAYLAGKGVLKVCVDPDWMPFERINKAGQHQGIAADFMALLAERAALKLDVLPTKSWTESLDAARDRRCDLLSMAAETPERKRYMNFTSTYVSFPMVFAARAEELFVDKIDSVLDKPIAMVKGYAFTEVFKARYPKANIIEAETAKEGIRMVQNKRAYMLVESLPSVINVLQAEGIGDIKVIGRLDDTLDHAIAVRNDQPQLLSIMQKAVDSISEDERRAIVNKWVAVRVEQGLDYSLFWKMVVGASMLMVGFLWRNRDLARFNRSLMRARDELRAKNTQIDTLLNTSGQGFLSFDHALRVDDGFSRECTRIFQRPQLDLPLPELLCPDDIERQRFVAKTLPLVIDSADDALRRDAYIELLPAEYALHGRYYRAEYKLIDATRMMLVLTDISDAHRLRERLSQERLCLELVVNALESRDELLGLLRDYEHFRSHVLPDLLSRSGTGAAALAEIFRHIHTFKSLFAQASMPTLPALLHKLESKLAPLRERGDKLDVNDIKRELGAVDPGAALDHDLAILRAKLGDEFFSSEREIRVPESTLDALEQESVRLYGADPHIAELVQRLRYEPLQRLLAPHFRAAEQLAARQDKQLTPIRYVGDNVIVDPRQYSPFCKSLIHLFRNAVDHGIEYPDSRLLGDKDEQASIRCEVRAGQHELALTIADDGCGINVAAVTRNAIARGMITPAQAARMNDQQKIRLIFADGLSTLGKAGSVSGRGVGLAAVLHELEAMGGTVEVLSAPGKGCSFKFRLPYRAAIALARPAPGSAQAERFLAPLPKAMMALCEQHLKLDVHIDAASTVLAGSALLDFNAVIALGSGANACLGLSLERGLLLELARRYEPDFGEEDVLQLADSVGAEIVNTLVGNSMVYFTHLAHQMEMGTPQIIAPEQRGSFFGARPIHGFKGRCGTRKFIVFCVITEETTP